MHCNSRSTAKTELENMLAEGWDLKNSVSSLKSIWTSSASLTTRKIQKLMKFCSPIRKHFLQVSDQITFGKEKKKQH